jgi:hypothetical protein
MITYGPVFVANINEDFDLVQKIVERDYTRILKDPSDETYGDHPIKKPGVLWCPTPPRFSTPPPLPATPSDHNAVIISAAVVAAANNASIPEARERA